MPNWCEMLIFILFCLFFMLVEYLNYKFYQSENKKGGKNVQKSNKNMAGGLCRKR